MTDQLSEAQQKLMAFINDPVAARAFGSTLAEIAVELMDAKQEAKHWKTSFETVRDEIKVLAGVAMRQKGESRLVITKAALSQMPANTELYVDTPEPGVRVYELRTRHPALEQAVSQILKPN